MQTAGSAFSSTETHDQDTQSSSFLTRSVSVLSAEITERESVIGCIQKLTRYYGLHDRERALIELSQFALKQALRSEIALAGGIEALTELIVRPDTASMQENAIKALANLIEDEGYQDDLFTCTGVRAELIRLASDHPQAEIRKQVVNILSYAVKEKSNRQIMGDADLIKIFLALISDTTAELDKRHMALVGLRDLTSESPLNQELVGDAGGVTLLISLLLNSSEHLDIREYALKTLGHMASSQTNKMRIVAEGGIDLGFRLSASKAEPLEVRAASINFLFSLANGCLVHQKKIADAGGFELLMGLICDPSESLVIQQHASWALQRLAVLNKRMEASSAVDGVASMQSLVKFLIFLMKVARAEIKEHAVRIFTMLAGIDTAEQALAKADGLVFLMSLLDSYAEDPLVREQAALTLVDLMEDPVVLVDLIDNGIVHRVATVLREQEVAARLQNVLSLILKKCTKPESASSNATLFSVAVNPADEVGLNLDDLASP